MNWLLWWRDRADIVRPIEVVARNAAQAMAVAFALVPAVSVSLPRSLA